MKSSLIVSSVSRVACVAVAALMIVLCVARPACGADSPTSSGEVATVDTPILRIPMVSKPPTIDGTFKEGEWEEASSLSGFWYDWGSADFRYLAPPQTQLQVFACYDKENIYLAYVSPVYPEKSWFRAQGRFPDVIHHPLYGLQWDDHIELELRPHEDITQGFRMGLYKWFINPIGTVSDNYWSLKAGPGWGWQSGATVKSAVTDKQWVVEIAMPLKNMAQGEYAGKLPSGEPIVKLPPPDGTAYRSWFTRAIGGNGDFFNAFDNHIWNTTKTKLIFDSTAPSFQINELGPVMEDNIDLQVTLKNHNKQSETVRLGFFVESAGGLVYSSYEAPELKEGMLELLPGEVKKIRLRKQLPGISRDGNVLWFDVRSSGRPAKVLFRTRLIEFHSMEGGATDGMTFKQRRVDVIQQLRPPKKDFDFRWDFSQYKKTLAAVVDIGINGASEDAKRAKEAKLTVMTADANERVIIEKRIAFNGDFAADVFELTGITPGESYKLSLLLFDENKRIVGEANPDPFKYEVAEWMNNKLGLDDVVWEPYVPVKATEKNVETLKHTITLDASGLPAQIAIKPDARELPLEKRLAPETLTPAELLEIGRGPQLRAPIRLEATVGGQKVAAQVTQPAKAIRTWKSEVEYESKLKIGPIDATLTTRYDCDGSLHARLTYGSKDAAVVDRLELVTDFAGQVDLAVSTKFDGGMQGADKWECGLPMDEGVVWDSAKLDRAELFYSHFVPWMFVGSGDRGFTFFADSDRNWFLDLTGTSLTIERDKAKNATMRNVFVNHKTDVKGERALAFTILTHPSKPKPKDARKLAWLYRGDSWAANYRMEKIDLDEDYLKRRLREATGAPKEVADTDLATYRKDTPPWVRYGRLRNEGVWPVMDKNWEDKAVFYMERQIRVGRRVGLWWDEYWPVYRSNNLAEGDAYLRDPKTIGKNEIPWQSAAVTTYMRDMFKRMSRVHTTNNVPNRHFLWASNSATLLESFAWDTQLVEECGAAHRARDVDVITQYPSPLWRYMAHNYTGLVARVVADVGIPGAGDEPQLERQLYGRALLNDIGVSPDGPHGRMSNNENITRIVTEITKFGLFDDPSVEVIPYWRIAPYVRYGTPANPDGAFNLDEANPLAKVYVTAFRRPVEIAGKKGVQTMLVVMNENDQPLREQLYIVNPTRVFGGNNAQTINAAFDKVDMSALPTDSDYRKAKLMGFRKPDERGLVDLESGGVVVEAPNKGGPGQVYGPLWVPGKNFRILYGYSLVK